MSDPDFERLHAVNDELDELEEAGTLTSTEFDRLLSEAREAVGDRTEFLEGILLRGMLAGFVAEP